MQSGHLLCGAFSYAFARFQGNAYPYLNAKRNRPALFTAAVPFIHFSVLLPKHHALFAEPNNSIFSFTVALIASAPGANSLRGSYPLPC